MNHKKQSLSFILVILLCSFIGLFISGIYSYFIQTPEYISRADMLIQLPQTEQSQVNSDDKTSTVMFNTYKGVLESKTMCEDIAKKMPKSSMSAKEIEQALDVKQAEQSQMITVTATTKDPILSHQLLTTSVDTFKAKLPRLMQLSGVKVVSQPTFNPKAINMNHALMLVLGTIIGFMVGLVISFIQWRQNRIMTSRQSLYRLKAPVIGSIPQMSQREQSVRIHRTATNEEDTDSRTRDLSEDNEMVDQLLKQETQQYDTLIRRRRKR